MKTFTNLKELLALIGVDIKDKEFKDFDDQDIMKYM